MVNLAAAQGVVLDDVRVDSIFTMAQSLQAQGRSSLHDDLVAGRRVELEALHGEVVRRADKAGLEVPVTRTIYGLLHPYVT